jgi:hypothetical protein
MALILIELNCLHRSADEVETGEDNKALTMPDDLVLEQGSCPMPSDTTQGEVLHPSNMPDSIPISGPRHFTRVRDVIQLYRDGGVKEPKCDGGGSSQAPRSCPHVFPVCCKWRFICGCFGNLAQIDPHNMREATNMYFL